jgi:DNA transformation protein
MSSELVETVMDLLAPWRDVSARRLFSGHGLYRDGLIFAIVIRDTLYLKADAQDRDRFVTRGLSRFTYERKRRVVSLNGYFEAPPEVFDDGDEMIRWCEGALAAARRIRDAKPPRARRAAR